MSLASILERLADLDDSSCIFARKPWGPDSIAEVASLEANFDAPKEVSAQSLEYFLEVHVAKEVVEVFGERKPSASEVERLLIFYAENDAYPDWVYK